MKEDKLYKLCTEYIAVCNGLDSLQKGALGDGVDKGVVERHVDKLKELEQQIREELNA